MKIKFFSRLLIAISGLLLIGIAVVTFIYMNNILPITVSLKEPTTLLQRIIYFGGTAIVIALGVFCISVLFRSGKDRGGFVIQNSDFGEVSISIHAMENMVHHCVDAHKELTAKAIRMRRSHDGVQVDLRVLLQSGLNIPQTVTTLQKEIKEYIADSSGVPVTEVRVMVETDPHVKARHNVLEVAPQAAAAAAKQEEPRPQEAPKAEPKKELMIEKLFKKEEPVEKATLPEKNGQEKTDASASSEEAGIEKPVADTVTAEAAIAEDTAEPGKAAE